MDVKKVTAELKKEYPGAKIIVNDKNKPSEILCEVDPSAKHPGFSTAVSVIDKTEPHSHERSAEIYYVLRGKLELFLNNERYILTQDQFKVIPPQTIHFAQGTETWVLVYAEPGWSKEDHISLKERPLSFIPHLTHLRLLVDNYAVMFEFYKNTLGLTLKWGEKTGNYAEFDVGDVSIGLFKKKLMVEALPKEVAQSIISSKNQVVINLEVEKVEQSYQYLTDKKVTFLTKPKDYPAWGIKAAHILDPEGNLIEIYEDLK